MVDLEEPTLTLKDASGLGDAPTKSQAGDSATGKVGSTTFAFSDPSGNLALAPMSADGVKTDGSAVTQPVSAVSLPLPTGASTSANQTNGSHKTQVVNSAGTSVSAKDLTTQIVDADVGLVTSTIIHGRSTAGGGTFVDVKVNPSGTLPVEATQDGVWNITNITGTVSLPTGAATSANQATANASLASIDAGIPAALGQATEANSMPVTIASDQDYPFANTHNSSNPDQAISIGADDTANIRRLQGRISDPLTNDFGLLVRQIPRWPQTFMAHAESVAIGNGKSMLSLLNASGSGVIIRVHEVKIFNVQTTAVTGVVAEFGLRKITTHSAGTQLTTTGAATGLIFPMDSNNSLNASVTLRTGATVTESPAFDIINWFWSSDEWGVGTQDVESLQHSFAQSVPSYKAVDGLQPFVLREGQGLHIRQATNSTAGSFDVMFVFTQETA